MLLNLHPDTQNQPVTKSHASIHVCLPHLSQYSVPNCYSQAIFAPKAGAGGHKSFNCKFRHDIIAYVCLGQLQLTELSRHPLPLIYQYPPPLINDACVRFCSSSDRGRRRTAGTILEMSARLFDQLQVRESFDFVLFFYYQRG